MEMSCAFCRFGSSFVIVLVAFGVAPLASHAANFLAPDQIDLRAALPPPPAADSTTTRAELETLVQLERSRTPAQTEFARNPPTGDVFAFAGEVLGPWFAKEKLPATAALFARIDDDGRALASAAKAVYAERPRPWLADARLVAPTSRPGGSTYPSGAGYNTGVWVGLLATLFPDQAEALRERARLVCWSRILAGVHYPTDNVAGLLLGDAVAKKLLALPDFQAGFAAVRAELAQRRPR